MNSLAEEVIPVNQIKYSRITVNLGRVGKWRHSMQVTGNMIAVFSCNPPPRSKGQGPPLSLLTSISLTPLSFPGPDIFY